MTGGWWRYAITLACTLLFEVKTSSRSHKLHLMKKLFSCLSKRQIVVAFLILIAIGIFFVLPGIAPFGYDFIWEKWFIACIGIIFSAIITLLLLRGQSKEQLSQSRSEKVYEKKLDTYNQFLETLGKITEDKKLEESEEVHLRIWVAKLAMYTNADTLHKVCEQLKNFILCTCTDVESEEWGTSEEINKLKKDLNLVYPPSKRLEEDENVREALMRSDMMLWALMEIMTCLKGELYLTEQKEKEESRKKLNIHRMLQPFAQIFTVAKLHKTTDTIEHEESGDECNSEQTDEKSCGRPSFNSDTSYDTANSVGKQKSEGEPMGNRANYEGSMDIQSVQTSDAPQDQDELEKANKENGFCKILDVNSDYSWNVQNKDVAGAHVILSVKPSQSNEDNKGKWIEVQNYNNECILFLVCKDENNKHDVEFAKELKYGYWYSNMRMGYGCWRTRLDDDEWKQDCSNAEKDGDAEPDKAICPDRFMERYQEEKFFREHVDKKLARLVNYLERYSVGQKMRKIITASKEFDSNKVTLLPRIGGLWCDINVLGEEGFIRLNLYVKNEGDIVEGNVFVTRWYADKAFQRLMGALSDKLRKSEEEIQNEVIEMGQISLPSFEVVRNDNGSTNIKGTAENAVKEFWKWYEEISSICRPAQK